MQADPMNSDPMNSEPMQAQPAPGARPDVASLDRLRTIFEAAPQAAAAQAKVWGVLTDAQKPIVQAALERYRQDEEARRMGMNPEAAPSAPARITSIDDPRIPERARERLKNLTPEQQQEALRRLNERLGERGTPPAGRGTGEGEGRPRRGQRPPPSMDDVDVPRPDGR
jgi:hypothetical protein